MTHIMKTEECFDDLEEMKKTLCRWVDQAIANGPNLVSANELGAAIDMIKGLSQSQKDLWESCYYKSVVDAMEEYDENPRMGYNPNRGKSGRYMPKRMGYVDPIYYDRMMGYTDGKEHHWDDEDRTYGHEFNNFRKAKRHYTETHSEEDRRKMNEHADKHLNQTITTLKEIWADADPDLRMRMKNDLTNLSNEMIV